MKSFTTKAHLLKEVSSIATLEELRSFAREVRRDPLTDAHIVSNGTSEEIIASLIKAPKAVLESVYELFFVDPLEEEEDEDEEDEDEEEDDEDQDEDQDQDEEE